MCKFRNGRGGRKIREQSEPRRPGNVPEQVGANGGVDKRVLLGRTDQVFILGLSLLAHDVGVALGGVLARLRHPSREEQDADHDEGVPVRHPGRSAHGWCFFSRFHVWKRVVFIISRVFVFSRSFGDVLSNEIPSADMALYFSMSPANPLPLVCRPPVHIPPSTSNATFRPFASK